MSVNAHLQLIMTGLLISLVDWPKCVKCFFFFFLMLLLLCLEAGVLSHDTQALLCALHQTQWGA